ncbi:helicase-related protein [Deinococcus fonticola]|uniref:helicase-related protein n=1 Tax=Deinococcus fonticola TaxID=2528713 RepID=UPI00107542BF|nr:helicase-related protein [Deinococcus fonticola]
MNLPKGSIVRCPQTGQTGHVLRGHDPVDVQWQDGSLTTRPASTLRCGFGTGTTIVERPSTLRTSRGEGQVIGHRTLGGREQLLVDFWQGERHWLPWQNLLPIWSPAALFDHRVHPPTGSAERFRLRQLSHALQHWAETTGALSPIDIDPLPHQIHLVHRILSSAHLDWLIADDVGLGKTIEVGLLLTALRRRRLRRFLLVVPSGITRQWQAELRDRFGLREAVIYGEDFHISDDTQWRLYDLVIVSMDRLKQDAHLEKLQRSGRWDLAVFDEAHRLSRRQYGRTFKYTDRYRMALEVRRAADAVLLLTGTPHQGDLDRFQALLELLRPDPQWRQRIQEVQLHPEILSGMIIRNRKADVTDAQGNFIFKGKVTRAIETPIGDEERQFEAALGRYFQRGYQTSARLSAQQRGARAIGFVMTTYRKLAASSALAIHRALERRLQRLTSSPLPSASPQPPDPGETLEDDEQATFEQPETAQGDDQPEFFDGEVAMLENLLAQSTRLLQNDRKLQAFLELLIDQIDQQEKVLIFTEYRSTQEQLLAALEERCPGKVDVIHGGQHQRQRQAAIEHFEDAGRFLVSTEAGGEGFNLQRRCHILINYDQPWNPMRLVQRVGRLYRYGQELPVIVFNLRTQGNLDDLILDHMYSKLEAVAAGMAAVSDEYREGLHEDILGSIAGFLDVAAILEEGRDVSLDRTQERIDEALERARQAARRQEDLMRFASSFDPDALNSELPMDQRHLPAFIEGMLLTSGGEVRSRLHGGAVWEINLGEGLGKTLNTRQLNRIAFTRQAANRHRAELIDNGHPLLKHFFKQAQEYDFQGQVACLSLPAEVVGCTELRWQDESGKPMRESYRVFYKIQGNWTLNPPAFSEWLLKPTDDAGQQESDVTSSDIALQADTILCQECTDDTHPAGLRHVGLAWGSEI